MKKLKDNGRGDWFPTYYGHKFWLLDPQPEEIDIRDIAHALSLICRYNGHLDTFYSVAQHSVYVADVCRPEYALHGLLHDGTEAYCGDVIRPLKKLLSNYSEIEESIAIAIAAKFGYNPYQHAKAVKTRDEIILCTEYRDVVRRTFRWKYAEKHKPAKFIIEPCLPEVAEQMFLNKFEELYAKHKPNFSWTLPSWQNKRS